MSSGKSGSCTREKKSFNEIDLFRVVSLSKVFEQKEQKTLSHFLSLKISIFSAIKQAHISVWVIVGRFSFLGFLFREQIFIFLNFQSYFFEKKRDGEVVRRSRVWLWTRWRNKKVGSADDSCVGNALHVLVIWFEDSSTVDTMR